MFPLSSTEGHSYIGLCEDNDKLLDQISNETVMYVQLSAKFSVTDSHISLLHDQDKKSTGLQQWNIVSKLRKTVILPPAVRR
jgi:hypothetical protein